MYSEFKGKVVADMEKLVNGTSVRYIVELDKKARERVAAAKQEAMRIESEAESKKQKMLADYKEQAREGLRKMEDSYRAEAEKEIARIESEKKQKTEAFDSALAENREKLMDEVFTAVTGAKRRK